MTRAFAACLIALGLTSAVSCIRLSRVASSYNFSAASSASLSDKSFTFSSNAVTRAAPTLCSSVICVTPTALTGKYYATGLLIQASGSGMVAYFGQPSFSSISGTSTSYDFNMNAPVTNTGNLVCCGGTGDLSSSSTYISDAIYMFAYIDATFDISGTSTGGMNREFTVRFVLADDAISTGRRGDLLLKDPVDDVFKWMDTSVSAGGIVGAGTLVTSRPTTPVTMNTSVTNWTNPFGTNQGNQSIPVLFAPVTPASGTGVVVTSQTELAADGKVYTFGFDPDSFVMFPTLLTADINLLSTYTELLSRIHLAGLPHSAQPLGVGSPASTELVVTSGP